MMFSITRYSAYTPLGTIEESVHRIRALDVPDGFALTEERYRACRNDLPYAVPKTLDNTALLALWLLNDIMRTAHIGIVDTPVIVANSKGGVRTLANAFDVLPAEKLDERFMIDAPFYNASAAIAEFAGVRAPILSVQSACATGMTALVSGCRMLERGYDQVLVIGVESAAVGIMHAGFAAMGVLTEGVMRPFSVMRSGFRMAEGGAAVLLSRDAAKPLARIERWADIHDNTHPVRFDGQGRMIQKALGMLGYAPADIDIVSAHGTATGNDIAEARAIAETYGDVPVTGLKPYIGHMLGASAIAEIVLTIALARGGYIAHLPWSEPIDPLITASILTKPRLSPLRRFVKLAYGFGGSITAAGISVG